MSETRCNYSAVAAICLVVGGFCGYMIGRPSPANKSDSSMASNARAAKVGGVIGGINGGCISQISACPIGISCIGSFMGTYGSCIGSFVDTSVDTRSEKGYLEGLFNTGKSKE